MALFQKLDESAATKTHGAVDATIVDVILPTVPLADSTSNLARSALYGLAGWMFRGKKETGAWSL